MRVRSSRGAPTGARPSRSPASRRPDRAMPAARKPRRRTSLAPRKEKRGLDAAEIALAPDAPEVAPLAAEVRAAGGAPIGAYREPLSGRALLLAALPLAAVAADAVPARPVADARQAPGAQKIDETGAFLDPLIVVRGAGRPAVDAERPPPPGGGQGAGPEADHGAGLARRGRSPSASSRSTPRRRTTSRTAASR